MIRSFSTSSIRISPDLKSFFSRHSKVFLDHPNLWVKGGAARDALLNLFLDEDRGYTRESESPRDWDLVLFNKDFNSREWRGKDPDWVINLLKEFGGEVYRQDFEVIRNFDYYFNSRDIGLNQILINPKEMLVTDIAIRDAKRGHVSPTLYEYRKSEDFSTEEDGVGPKVALRSLLIGIRDGLKIRDSVLRSVKSASPFWVLMFLFKAGEIGLGDRFFEELKRNHPLLENFGNFEESLLKVYKMVPGFIPTTKQLLMLRDAENNLSEDEPLVFNKKDRKRDWIEARLISLDFALRKYANLWI